MAPPLANLRSSLGQTKDYKILTKELASKISKYEPSYFYLIDCSHKTMYSDFYIWKYHPTNAINLVLFFLQDPALKSSLPVIELIDAMSSGVINYSFVIKSSGTLGEEVSSHFHYRAINSQLILYAWGFLAHFHPVAFLDTIFTSLIWWTLLLDKSVLLEQNEWKINQIL